MNFGLACDTFKIWEDKKYELYGFISGEEKNSLLLKDKTTDRFLFYRSSDGLIHDITFYFDLHKDRTGMDALEEAIEKWEIRSDIKILKFILNGDFDQRIEGVADVQIGEFLIIEGVRFKADGNKPILELPVEEYVQIDEISQEILKRKLSLSWAQAVSMTFETPDMDVTVTPIVNGGMRKASVKVEIGSIVLKNIEVRQGKYGLFVSFPSVRTQSGWKKPVFFKTQPAEDKVKADILFAYQQYLEKKEPTRNEKSL